VKVFPAFGLTLLLLAPAHAQLAAPSPAGIAMGHVHLNVKDVEVQKKFWMDQFGAVPLKKEGLAGVKMPGMLILFRKQDATGGSEFTTLDHFGLKVPNLKEAIERCKQTGCTLESEFKGTEGFPNAYIFGPDQVKIEMQQDTELKQPAIGYHLHYISADPVALRDWYAKTFSAVVKKRGQHDAADIPGMNLTFGTSKNPPTVGTKGRSLDHAGFEVKNLEAFCRKLEASGVKFDMPYRKLPNGLAIAFLTDPVGVYLELTEGLDQY
jgi:catechol 2,3-dioxygenase-like lactoylglutathione lyase family enzyme